MARNHDVAAALVHLEDFNRLRDVHQRGDVADRTDVDLATRQEGHGAVQIDGEAALDLVEDDAFDALGVVELGFETDPAFLAARLFARQHGLAESVLDALDIDFNFVADVEGAVLRLGAEFLERDATFDLQADVDDRHILFNGGDGALGNITFRQILIGDGFCEEGGKILLLGNSL